MAHLPDRQPSGPASSEPSLYLSSPASASAAHLRASDADRERVAAVLHAAATEGRLDLTELHERLGAVYAARTYGDLEPVIEDLAGVPPRPAAGGAVSRAYRSGHAVAVMSEFSRKGPWLVPAAFTGLSFWGGGHLDLREARFAGRDVTIRAYAIMGGITVVVPDDAEVHVTGVGVMGRFDHMTTGPGSSASARITIKGLALWGGVFVKRRARGEPADD